MCISFDFTYTLVDKRVFVTFTCFSQCLHSRILSCFLTSETDLFSWPFLLKWLTHLFSYRRNQFFLFIVFCCLFWCLIWNKFANVRTWKCKCHPWNTDSFLSRNRAVKQKSPCFTRFSCILKFPLSQFWLACPSKYFKIYIIIHSIFWGYVRKIGVNRQDILQYFSKNTAQYFFFSGACCVILYFELWRAS